MASKIILFELNEVPFRIIDAFAEWRPSSNLAHLLNRCKQFDTFAEDEGHLSPWKTWPTVHRGVVASKHLINDFGQDLSDIDGEYPPIWKLLSAAGVPTGVCGSLHTYPLPNNIGDYSFFIPDTFAAGAECFPDRLSAYQEFNLQMARDSARNVSTRVPWKAALRFLAAAPGLGLTPHTVAAICGQLLSERIANWRKIRRRTYQVVLAFDVWMKELQRSLPAFTTFFTNHVASSMHRYWAARFPEEYETFGYDDDWVRTYRNEIDFTMCTFDRFLGRLMAFVHRYPEYTLWIATSMGQAATQAEPIETQLFLENPAAFLERLGAPAGCWKKSPAMVPQYNFIIDESVRDEVRSNLAEVRVLGEPIAWREASHGFFSIDLGQRNLHDKPNAVCFRGERVDCAQMGLSIIKIEDRSGSSAYHIPHGSLLIYSPQRSAATYPRAEVSTVEIAPALLKNFNVPAPRYMAKATHALAGLS